jgi:hypothetical protein
MLGRMQPSWRRIVTGSLATFAVVLGFLAGRMNAGADPGIARSTTAHAKVVKKTPATQSGSTTSTGATGDGSTPTYDDGSADPYGGGSTGTYGGGSATSSDPSPPVTASS